jgi:lipopolysaccharide export system permease protein
VHFDLSAFKLNRTDEELFKTHYSMLNILQLDKSIDSLDRDLDRRQKEIGGFIAQTYRVVYDTMTPRAKKSISIPQLMDTLKPEWKRMAIQDAINQVGTLKGYTDMLIRESEAKQKEIARYDIEWHRKFTLSFACFVLFLIGAPLGAIIRKGGLGLPMVFCILFFLIYHVLSVVFEKTSRELVLPPSQGMWVSSAVLFPVGLFLLFKANNDSKLFDAASYKKLFHRLFKRSKNETASIS